VKKFFRGKERQSAEFIGTFFLVFCGTGAIAAGSRFSSFGAGPLGVALAFGMALMLMVFALGHISGAHFNPAVSVAFYSIGKLDKQELTQYVSAQGLGALAASVAVKALVQAPSIGETGYSLLWIQAWGVEALATFLLVFVIMAVATDKRAPGMLAGIAIGGAIVVDAIWAGPLTGASMNPARSLAPALVSFQFGGILVYLTAPFAGAWAAAQVYQGIRGDE
jgi:MIP family channel proteins